jgi:dihydrofolate synthase/folylpolyglutamate synthase
VFHVAGTNGKGSTCAFLRAALEAAGHRVHVFTSPHLVRFNERIRLAGRLIEDESLPPCFGSARRLRGHRAELLRSDRRRRLSGLRPHARRRLVLEVGMGGRLDATNVVPARW